MHSRFEDLQEILEKRAAHATGKERIDLVRRRAKLLEDKLNNPEAAASALRDLGDRGHRRRRAAGGAAPQPAARGPGARGARALSQRIEIERARDGADAGKRVAELNLELSLLKLDDLHDPAAARKEVEAALEAAPENPAALAALAQLHLKQNDFAAYAATRLREARALRGRPDAIDALLDAGRVFREQVQSPDKARACFEEALEEDPRNGEALRALASLFSAEANWDQARRVLERQLERHRRSHRTRQRAHRPRPHRVGGLQRRRRSAPIPRRGADAGPQPPARDPRRRRPPLQRRPVGAWRRRA